MKDAIIAKITNARAALRARGVRDTQDAVVKLVGGSKQTVNRYWHLTDPGTPTVAAVTIAAPRKAAAGMTAMESPAPAAAPKKRRVSRDAQSPASASGPPTDAEFEASFEALMEARIRFFACQEILGDNRLMKLPYWSKPREGTHGLWADHPLVERIEAAYDVLYDNHLALWKEMVPPSPYAYHGWVEPEPRVEPEPQVEPEPAELNLENLRLYYQARHASCWPDGVRLPLEVYPLLQTLWKEADAEQGKAQRDRYTVMNAAGPLGLDAAGMASVEDRMSAASVVIHHIKSDMNLLQMRAHDEGVTLPR